MLFPMTKRPTILVVDDDAPIRGLMTTVLREFSYDPLTAASGDEALELARSSRPDLVLLDMKMPGMSGEEAVSAFRRDSELRDIPIIILSGEPVNGEDLSRIGADAAIQKPFDISELLRRVQHQLQLGARAGMQSVAQI